MTAKKKASITNRAAAPGGLKALLAELRGLILSARQTAASTINTLQVLTNLEIGRRIVKHEQMGAQRAAYGSALLKELSARLTEEFGRGFSEDNLSNMRKFFLLWEPRVAEFPNRLFGNSLPRICQSGKAPALPTNTTSMCIGWRTISIRRSYRLHWIKPVRAMAGSV